MPDIGARYEETETTSSPSLSWPIYNETGGTSSVWVRGMAPDAGGDSLHVGLDSGTPSTAADLTGFTDEWSWSRVTPSGNATLDLTTTGEHTLEAYMREDGLRVDRVLLVTDTNYIPSGLGPAESPFQTITETVPGDLQTQGVQHSYDGLHRLTQAAYTGAFNGTFEYEYDAVGNRVAYTTTITATTVITYQYDATNRLLESAEQGSDGTAYEWDSAGRLITTTVSGAVTRLYHYDQRGNLISATVDGLTTTFDYDGDNHRLRMTIDNDVVTYTLDYARAGQVLFEEGGAYSNTKHYLYGQTCIGEHVDADNPETVEWRYYQQDGSQMVRQTTDESGAVTRAWTFSPEGMVLEGEEGPVTHMDCGGDAVYDWSTGLIFKGGRYFDPTLGIWLIVLPLVVWQVSSGKKGSRKVSKRKKTPWLTYLLLLLVVLTLTACEEPEPTPTPECDPATLTPMMLDLNVAFLDDIPMGKWDQDLAYANTVFDQAQITLRESERLSISSDDSEKILNLGPDDGRLDIGHTDFHETFMTPEECLLTTNSVNIDVTENQCTSLNRVSTPGLPSYEPRFANGNISVFYVPAIKPIPGARSIPGGKALLQRNYPSLPPSVIVARDAAERTLPHELGHVFLGGGHPDDPRNLLSQTPDAAINPETNAWYDELTWSQIEIIRNSEFVK